MEQKTQSDLSSADLLIARFLGETASADECRQLENWINETPENRVYFKQMKALWDSSYLAGDQVERSLESSMKKLQRSPMRLLSQLQKIAAVLFLPLLLGSILLFFQYKQQTPSQSAWIQTSSPFGSLSKIELPDGSKVWLNTGSSLSYPVRFDGSDRTVKLEGEAYFEVVSDPSNPFEVQTATCSVTATGTRFSIMAYKGMATHQVTLAEGKVKVGNLPNKREIHLKANQNLRLNVSTGQASLEEADAYKYFAWKDGRIIFRNDRLSDIADRLSLQYNTDIEIQGDISELRFRATFENETLTEVLNLLKLASPFVYEEQSPQYQADGSFSRRKIILQATSNQK